jgi:ribosome-associated heat shock protein Hsp15
LDKQRLDKWLFFARAVKSRSLAQKLIETGVVRVNSERTIRTDRLVGEGDVLTMTVHQRLLVWKIRDAGDRRGPPAEARGLYEDLSPPVPPPAGSSAAAGMASRKSSGWRRA